MSSTRAPTFAGTAYPYSASAEVENMHGIARYSHTGDEISENTFGQPDFATYMQSLVLVPAFLSASGVVALLLYSIFSNCGPGTCWARNIWHYVCCWCLCCPEGDKEVEEHVYQEKKDEYISKQVFWQRASYFVLFILLICDLCIFVGNASLTEGLNTFNSSIHTLSNFLAGIIDSTVLLTANAVNFGNTAAQTGACTSATYDSDSTTVIEDLSADISILLQPIQDLADSSDTMVKNAIIQKDNLVGAYVALWGILIISYAAIVFYRSKIMIYPINIVSYVLIILSYILCAVVMIITTAVADFCVDPTGNLLSNLGSGSQSSTLVFYVSCVGENSFEDDMSGIFDNLDVIEGYLDTIEPFASSNTCYIDLVSYYDGMVEATDTLNSDLMGCHHINKFYHELIEESFCNDLFRGVYQSFALIYFMSAMLFILLCCTSQLYKVMPNFDDSSFAVKAIESQHLGGGKITKTVVDESAFQMSPMTSTLYSDNNAGGRAEPTLYPTPTPVAAESGAIRANQSTNSAQNQLNNTVDIPENKNEDNAV